jgi:DNA-binding transcriptional LysR family regulator
MNEPDILGLKAFCSIAREGTVSRAAATLHLTQPAVSLQLKGLQERMQLQLFARAGRGLVLTRDGVALLPQAEKVLAALQEFGQSARGLQAAVRGRLRIGTILDPEFTRLGAFLKELVEAAPQIDTELSQHMSGDVWAKVDAGELDMGFYLATRQELVQAFKVQPFFKPNRPFNQKKYAHAAIKIIATELTAFTYRVLAPAGWGPQVMGKDWRALSALPWIITPPASAHHRLLQSVFEPLGVSPKRAALVDQEASMLDLVRSGVGLSLARDTIAMREAQARGLVVADRVALPCSLCYIHRADASHELVIQTATRALHNVWAV